MAPIENLLAFVVAAFVLIAIPGPSVLFTIGRSIALGRRSGFLSILGIALGGIPIVIAVALGVGAVIAQSVVVFTIVKIAGAVYLAYLGVHAIRHRKDAAAATTGRAVPRAPFRQVTEGFVVGLTNPKTIAFFVAVLPQFVDVRSGSVPLQLVEFGVVVLVIGLVCDSIWVVASSAARNWFGRSPRRMSAMSATGGALMIGLGGILVISGSKPATP
ncbi:lysine transporter LysE [Agromyces sp. Root81]|uniref:LysE family translocator n=1 Tax=Agromyces sp. Root81 TaxID=1736601 RepID=UPI0006FF386C|nr:LysE family translocator [Agromyces sp. Root81]KRC62795.1 lysine transporter LysE [Agromyces sp. Root81]